MDLLVDQITTNDKALLLKICTNILKEPNVAMYRNLNYKKVYAKFSSKLSIDLLIHGGFIQQFNDEERLIVNENDIDKIKTLYSILTETDEKCNDNNIIGKNILLSQIIELMESGFSIDEAESALSMSLDLHQKIDCNLDMDVAVNYFVNSGFDEKTSMNIIVSSKYDIREALQMLINQKQMVSDDTECTMDDNKEEKSEAFSRLIEMGFSEQESSTALQATDNNINAAIQYLIQNTEKMPQQKICSFGGGLGSIEKCQAFLLLKKILINYQSIPKDMIINNAISILDSFHHLLLEHDSDGEFEAMHNVLGKCNIVNCAQFIRRYRERNQKQISENDVKQNETSLIQFTDDIMDKIHCHLYHSYDIGYRFNENERKQIATCGVDKKYEELKPMIVDKALLTMRQIINAKRKRVDPYIASNTFAKFNALYNANNKHDSYRFGHRYMYWKLSKKGAKERNSRIYYAQHYISPKFQTLKEELISNPFCQITIKQWENEYRKASIHQNTRYAKQIVADSKPEFSGPKTIFDDVIFGIAKGSGLTINHLISVIVYCGYSQLSYDFSATYRRLNNNYYDDNDWKQYTQSEIVQFCGEKIKMNICADDGTETVASIKGRHCKFYHMAKSINELLQLFSPPALG
eukprot:85650_1